MFVEENMRQVKRGWIEVISGCMFSGKTEELIRRLKRVKIANLNFVVFKPAIDLRFSESHVVSHDAHSIEAIPVKQAEDMLLPAQNADVVGIDEAQFFDEKIANICEKLAFEGKRVIVAGLDLDFQGKPFGPMPTLLAIADYATKLHAICMICGNIAHISYRKHTGNKDQVLLGEKDIYEPRCRICAVNN